MSQPASFDKALLLPDEVHQAAGMVSVQSGVSVEDALTQLCRYAAEYRQDVVAVAERAVRGTLRFGPRIPRTSG